MPAYQIEQDYDMDEQESGLVGSFSFSKFK